MKKLEDAHAPLRQKFEALEKELQAAVQAKDRIMDQLRKYALVTDL